MVEASRKGINVTFLVGTTCNKGLSAENRCPHM